MGSAKPAAWARDRSLALSVCKAPVCSRSSRASTRKAWAFCAAVARAMPAAAQRACRPRVRMSSGMVVAAFMG